MHIKISNVTVVSGNLIKPASPEVSPQDQFNLTMKLTTGEVVTFTGADIEAIVAAAFSSKNTINRERRITLKLEEGEWLRDAAAKAKTPRDLLSIPEIQSHLLVAAGVSITVQAAKYLEDSDLTNALDNLIAVLPDEDFVKNIVDRWILLSSADEATEATEKGQTDAE
jgi:hypothetical protein